jgi:hypothetical protein
MHWRRLIRRYKEADYHGVAPEIGVPGPETPDPHRRLPVIVVRNCYIDVQVAQDGRAETIPVSKEIASRGFIRTRKGTALLLVFTSAVICAAALTWKGSDEHGPDASFVLDFNSASGTVLSCCYEGWAGMVFTVGPKPIEVKELGRWMIEGNRNPHVLKLVDAETRTDVPGGSVTLSLAGLAPGRFHFAPFSSPVSLEPTKTYYLVSSEKALDNQQDHFYAHDAAVATSGVAFIRRPVRWRRNAWIEMESTGTSYGPLSFKYVAEDQR